MVPFGNFGWNFGFGWIIVIVTLILIAFGIVQLVRMMGSGGGPTCPPNETPLDVLNKRYARGEITKEEFEEKKKDL